MTTSGPGFRFDRFALNPAERVLTRDGQPLALRPKSFDLLRCLAERAGEVVAKREAFAAVWPGLAVSDDSLARCISDIRAALGPEGHRIVKTVPGRGYLLAAPVIAAGAPGGAPARTERPSIGVLPFSRPAADPDAAILAAGLEEDVTAALGTLGGIVVIARASMAAYADPVPDAARIGREIGLRYLVAGDMRIADGQVRVAARLLEAATAAQLWGEHYDRPRGGLFAIGDEITANIVGRIGTEVLVAEYARARRKPPHSLDAWECVVRALFHSSRQSNAETRIALALLDRALAADPDYARALGMKAWILLFRAFQGWEAMPEVLGIVPGLVAHGIAVDSAEPWPLLAQGMMGFAMRDNALSMAALTRAVTLSPNGVNAHGLLSLAHAFGGRDAEARSAIATAMRLSPRDTYLSDFELYNAFIDILGGRYERGLEFAQLAHRMRPGHAYPLLLAAAAAGHLGRRGAAAGALATLRALVPDLSEAWVERTSPFVRVEDRARFLQGLRRAGLRGAGRRGPPP